MWLVDEWDADREDFVPCPYEQQKKGTSLPRKIKPIYCSECKNDALCLPGTEIHVATKFCPHCGIKQY